MLIMIVKLPRQHYLNYKIEDRKKQVQASIYNFWADYKFQEGGSLKNLGIGAGFNGASKHDTVDNSISGQFELPNYTIFNTAVYYKIKKIKFGLKVNNITDKTYYKGQGTVNAQPSRAFLGTVSYKF
ncbi:TonB-dependent receptor [Tenacibaculum finnmarkense]|nr:TonB-dependent receptor [Tenacibaculum finnmarkense]